VKDEQQIGAFPVISDEDPTDGEDDPSLGAPGETFLKDWWLYPEGSKDSPIGIVHVQLTRTKKKLEDRDTMVCSVVFEFADGDELVASGVLPFRSQPHWIGNGRIAITGGTGVYEGLTGELVVKVQNPKRWSIGGP